MRTLYPLSVVLLLLGFATRAIATDETAVDFGRDVRPILSKHCFKCHGPDPNTREAGLRLDEEDAAIEDLGGYAAIQPGDPDASEVIVRITSEDDDLRMPPNDAELSESEVGTLRRWIESGGHYETHWSFVPPQRPALPDVGDAAWCAGEIDRWTLVRMEQADLTPAARAGRKSLIRRLYLDLTGTTPTPEEVDRFAGDDHPAAYRKLVDRLLATPEYAERFARPWLDLARYSDTNGYEKDRPRSIWPYRDWVIDAIANDMPFDQFSIEQLAGDMLPGASNDQRIATGFHRNTMLNEEGGIDPLEYRFYAMVDRVATTGTVWLGLTTGCAQCHTHKYDPITHTDYYSLMALLNNADEPDVVVEDAQRDELTQHIRAEIEAEADRLAARYLPERHDHLAANVDDEAIAQAFVAWFDKQVSQLRKWRSLRADSIESTMPRLTVLPDDSVLASGDVTKRDVYALTFPLHEDDRGATALRLEVLPHDSLPAGGPGMAFYEGRRGDFFLSELSVTLDGQPVGLDSPSHSFGKISVGSGSAVAGNVIDGEGSTGWSTSGAEGKSNHLVVNFAEPLWRRERCGSRCCSSVTSPPRWAGFVSRSPTVTPQSWRRRYPIRWRIGTSSRADRASATMPIANCSATSFAPPPNWPNNAKRSRSWNVRFPKPHVRWE